RAAHGALVETILKLWGWHSNQPRMNSGRSDCSLEGEAPAEPTEPQGDDTSPTRQREEGVLLPVACASGLCSSPGRRLSRSLVLQGEVSREKSYQPALCQAQ